MLPVFHIREGIKGKSCLGKWWISLEVLAYLEYHSSITIVISGVCMEKLIELLYKNAAILNATSSNKRL